MFSFKELARLCVVRYGTEPAVRNLHRCYCDPWPAAGLQCQNSLTAGPTIPLYGSDHHWHHLVYILPMCRILVTGLGMYAPSSRHAGRCFGMSNPNRLSLLPKLSTSTRCFPQVNLCISIAMEHKQVRPTVRRFGAQASGQCCMTVRMPSVRRARCCVIQVSWVRGHAAQHSPWTWNGSRG